MEIFVRVFCPKPTGYLKKPDEIQSDSDLRMSWSGRRSFA